MSAVGVKPADCTTQPQGDGLLIFLPPNVSERVELLRFVAALHTVLLAVNSAPGVGGVVRTRIAVSSGPIGQTTPLGFTDGSIIETADLLDCDPVRQAMAESSSDVVLIVTGHLVETFEQGYAGVRFGDVEMIDVSLKKARAWRGALIRRVPVLPMTTFPYTGQLDGLDADDEPRQHRKMWFTASMIFGAAGGSAAHWFATHHPEDDHDHDHGHHHPDEHEDDHDVA